jgi:phosphate:Na+ symporter
VLESADRRRVAEIVRMDDTLDTLHRAIERYLSDIDPDGASEPERRAIIRTLSFATNLEHAGDIIAKSLLGMTGKMIKRRLTLSPAGLAEIEQMVERLLENLQLAVSIFMSGSAHSAEALLAQKRQFRELEHAAAGAHFERIRQDMADSIETSGLHLDIVRDLKRINSHLTAIAYPLLAAAAE